MSKGNILIVVSDANKAAVKAVVKNANPSIDSLNGFCQFSLSNLEVDLQKNSQLSGLQTVLDNLGVDDYALAVAVDRLDTLDVYGNPKNFGLSKVLVIPGYTITIH
jgi:hypothetical protein